MARRGVLAVLFLAFAVTFDYSLLARSNLQAAPWGLAFPAIGVLALAAILVSTRGKRDGVPFAMTAVFFVAAFLSLGVMFWPCMIPYSITVAHAAAPEASLRFLFYGGVVVLPVIALYTIGVDWVFRGRFARATVERPEAGFRMNSSMAPTRSRATSPDRGSKSCR